MSRAPPLQLRSLWFSEDLLERLGALEVLLALGSSARGLAVLTRPAPPHAPDALASILAVPAACVEAMRGEGGAEAQDPLLRPLLLPPVLSAVAALARAGAEQARALVHRDAVTALGRVLAACAREDPAAAVGAASALAALATAPARVGLGPVLERGGVAHAALAEVLQADGAPRALRAASLDALAAILGAAVAAEAEAAAVETGAPAAAASGADDAPAAARAEAHAWLGSAEALLHALARRDSARASTVALALLELARGSAGAEAEADPSLSALRVLLAAARYGRGAESLAVCAPLVEWLGEPGSRAGADAERGAGDDGPALRRRLARALLAHPSARALVSAALLEPLQQTARAGLGGGGAPPLPNGSAPPRARAAMAAVGDETLGE